MNRGTHLLDLQEVENELRDKIAAYKRVQKELHLTSPASQARRAYEEAAAAEKAARARQHDLNLEWQGLIQKLDHEDKRLYDGSIKNPKELTNLQLEVEMLKKQRERLEEQALALIEEVDTLTLRATEAKATMERVEQETSKQQERLLAQEETLKRHIGRARRKREEMLTAINATDLEQYRYVQRLKNDTFAVALMQDGVCTACHIEVSASKRDTVERAATTTLVTCGNCGRILVG